MRLIECVVANVTSFWSCWQTSVLVNIQRDQFLHWSRKQMAVCNPDHRHSWVTISSRICINNDSNGPMGSGSACCHRKYYITLCHWTWAVTPFTVLFLSVLWGDDLAWEDWGLRDGLSNRSESWHSRTLRLLRQLSKTLRLWVDMFPLILRALSALFISLTIIPWIPEKFGAPGGIDFPLQNWLSIAQHFGRAHEIGAVISNDFVWERASRNESAEFT